MSLSKILLIIITSLLIALGGIGMSLSLAQGSPIAPKSSELPFVPGEIIIKFKGNVTNMAAQRSLKAIGLRTLEASSYGQLLRVQVSPGHEAATMADLLKRGDVEFATYNHRIQAMRDPNDTNYNWQWSLNQPNGPDINAPEAWDIFTGNSDVIIAMVDSGIDFNHPDLKDKLVAGYNFIDPSQPLYDNYSHGTHVAGIAAASSNNGIGVAGVSWGAKIMPLKVLDDNGSGSSYNLAQAVFYAVDHGAKVINISIGQKGSKWPCGMDEVQNAFDYAVSKGALTVVASGNDGQDGVNCPGAFDEVIAVGATTASDLLASFSNYGERLDVVAPGSSIYSTIPGSGYSYKSGTSMATPHVSGLAALIWSFDPTLSNSEVRKIIESTSDDLGTIGWDQRYGWGRINAERALRSLVKVSTSITNSDYYIGDNTVISPTYQVVTVTTNIPQSITWTVTVSPTVTWLEVAPDKSGTVSAASPGSITLKVTRPITYGIYTTTVTINIGNKLQVVRAKIDLHYVPHIYQLYIPLATKY